MSRRQAQLELPKETAAPVSRETRPPVHTGPIADQILHRVPLDRVDPSPLNPRQNFDEALLLELAASLAADGQLQPIVLRPIGAGADMRFSIVAGERRFRAAQLLGWRTIASVIRPELNEQAHARIAMIENLARTDLNPVEEARGYKQLLDLGMTQEEIADAVHRSRPAVANALRLLKAPEPVLAKLAQLGADGKAQLSPSHVLPLLGQFGDFPEIVVRVAEIAAQQHTPSKDLEKGLYELGYTFTSALASEKLAVETYRAQFDRAICQACPFGAYRGTRYGGGFCLKPEHFAELQKAARATKKAEVQQAIEQASTDGNAALKLRSLKYGAYERLDYGGLPKTCTPKCECRAVALDGGNRPVKICTKPNRLRQLKDEERRQEEANRKAMMEDLAQRCGAVLDQADHLRSRELAIVAASLCSQLDAKRFNAILAKHAPAVKAKAGDVGPFEQLQPLALVKIALQALLAKDIESLQWRGQAQYAHHYAGPAPKPEKTAKPSRRGRPRPLSPDPEAAITAIGAELHEILQAPA